MEYFATVADKRFILDWDKLPEQSRERVIRYGVQRIINDRAGGKDKTIEQKHADAQKMYDALVTGTIPTRGNAGVDSLTVETRRLALKAWLGTKDQTKAKDRAEWFKDASKDDKAAMADKVIAAQDGAWRAKLEETAKAAVKRKEAEREAKRKETEKVAATVDVDL